MSSSQQPSNNHNSANSNPYSDYEADESLQPQNHSQQPTTFEDRNEMDDNDAFEQMDPFQEYTEDDFNNDLVEPIQSNNTNEDDSVFSDVVQDAFKKYQNEFSQYWTYDDTIWENRFTDEELIDDAEQEELYAQMEECWNYMSEETSPDDSEKPAVDHSQLNPDAIEFKPSWLQPTSSSSNTNEVHQQ